MSAARDQGVPPPAAYANAPYPKNGYEEFVIEAFDELCTERSLAFGSIGAIPWTSIERYAVRHMFADDDVAFDDFVHHIRHLDDLWIKFRVEEIKREEKKRGQLDGLRGGHGKNRQGR